jgi:hypothetical protein
VSDHPSDWRWEPRQLRWEHPHSRNTIAVIEPAKASEQKGPTVPFGFGARVAAPMPDDDGVWEGMGL